MPRIQGNRGAAWTGHAGRSNFSFYCGRCGADEGGDARGSVAAVHPRSRVMRALATIIAAVLSVTTGGPLRCPCLLVPQIRAACVETVAPPSGDDSSPSGCRCRAHQEAEVPPLTPPDSPHQGRHEPPHAPCPHGPGIDLTAPPAGVEQGESQSGAEQPALVGAGTFALVLSTLGYVAASHPPAPPPATCQHLRFCHAFRC